MASPEDQLRAKFPKLPNLYEFMGVGPNSTEKEVKKAYRSLSFVYHPDKSDAPDAAEKFNTLKEAYDILRHKKLRKEYNKYLDELQEMERDKERMSARRKKFGQELRKREKAYEDSRKKGKFGQKPDFDNLYSFVQKKQKTENVETLFDVLAQSKMNEVIQNEKKNKKKIKKFLSTIVVSWSKKGTKSYTRLLLRMIFRRFGKIKTIELEKNKRKCYIEYEDLASPEYAQKGFKDREMEDLRVKFLVTEERDKYLEKYRGGASEMGLTRSNLDRIAGVYNGYSFEGRKEEMRREVERQRIISQMLEKEKNDVLKGEIG